MKIIKFIFIDSFEMEALKKRKSNSAGEIKMIPRIKNLGEKEKKLSEKVI